MKCDCGQPHCERNLRSRVAVEFTSRQKRELIMGRLSHYPNGRFPECLFASLMPTLSKDEIRSAISILWDAGDIRITADHRIILSEPSPPPVVKPPRKKRT